MGTPVTNFGKTQANGGYTAAAVTVTLITGHGSRLPATFPYPLVWWNSTDYPDPADDPDREIVTVTARAGDVLTVTRGAESTAASAKNLTGKTYMLALSITKGMWEELQARNVPQLFRGLRVQTHPSSDLALSQVLFSADAISMDDGEVISDWSNIAVNLAAGGANGLDTGSEAASTWYELWAIYNGATKAGLLHRAKNYLLDQDGSAGEDGSVALRDAADRAKVSQGLQLATAGPLAFVDVRLLKVGTPTGNCWFTVESDNGGVPSDTALATSDKFDVSRVNSVTAVWLRVPFRTPPTLSAATQYHLVLHGDFGISVTHHLQWRADTTAAAYANGNAARFDGATWVTLLTTDCLFKAYVTQNDTAVILPAGYTGKAKLGYVRNNASSNLHPFRQKDRTVVGGQAADWLLSPAASSAPALVSTAAVLPPVPVAATFLIYNGTSSYNALGDLDCTDLASGADVASNGKVSCTTPATQVAHLPPVALGPTQGMMYMITAGAPALYVSAFEW